MKEEPTAPAPADESQLHAFVDDRLDAAGRAAVQARLEADPALAATVSGWMRQKDALRALNAPVLDEPVPAALQQAARQLHHRTSSVSQWMRWGGLAASLLVAFGVGWGSHGEWRARQAASPLAAAPLLPAAEFARQARVAHAVYSPEVRHPVEVGAGQQEHLVQWLSKRLERPLKVPQLGEQGYELVGGRLLPGGQGARAQFMYQDAAGERITLYVGAVDGAAGAAGGETAFRFTSQDGVASFYWVDQGFGYALSGKLPRTRLLTLSEHVYRQL